MTPDRPTGVGDGRCGMPQAKAKKDKVKRSITAKQKAAIVAAGRRKERPPTQEVADQHAGGDVRIVRRVWQAAGLIEVNAATKERAQRLVATWIERTKS